MANVPTLDGMTHIDIRERVIAALEEHKGELRKVASESGLAYDTVLRIRNREGDPGYSKIFTLYTYFFGAKRRREIKDRT
jgi:hypothetical protein